MKIFNQPVVIQKKDNKVLNSKTPSFKAIQPVVIKQAKNVATNQASKEMLVKLAGLVGLSSLVAWVNSLKDDKNQEEVLNKLNILDSDWSSRGQEMFLNPSQQGQYLDLVSRADSAESMFWTQGMISKDTESVPSKELSQAEKDLFLAIESNEIYLSNSAKATIKSIVSQVQALSSAPEEVRLAAIKSIDAKLASLVQQADTLQNSENTAEIYAKVANIVKMFAIINLMNDKPIDAEKSKATEQAENKPEEIAEGVTNPAKREAKVELEQTIENLAVQIAEEPKSDIGTGKIDLEAVDPIGSKRRAKYKQKCEAIASGNAETIELEVVEENAKPQVKGTIPIEINDSNREFVTGVFLPLFKDQAAVNPEIYSEHIDLIQKIYENYSNDSVKASFLNTLKFSDKTPLLDLYSKLTNVDEDKIQFVNFAKIEQIKKENGTSLTKEEYDTLLSFYGSKVKYAEIFIEAPEKYERSQVKKHTIKINFMDGVSTRERLNIISKFHKIIFSVPEENSIKGESVEKVTLTDLQKELVLKLSAYFKAEKSARKIHLPGNYENILSFLRVDIDDLRVDYQRDGKAGLESSLEQALEVNSYKNELLELLNNENFADFIVTTHARMRFIDRFIFNDNNWQAKSSKALKSITTRAIKRLEESLAKTPYLQFINYYTSKSVSAEDVKYGARVNFFNDTVIGLDENGYIHTMF